MAFYTDIDLGINRPLALSDMEPSIWQGVKATFDLALDTNPLASIRRINKYYNLDSSDLENPQEMIEIASAITGSDFGLDYNTGSDIDNAAPSGCWSRRS